METRAFLKSITLYEDDDVMVLNKPAGLAVQGGSGTTRHLDGMLGSLTVAVYISYGFMESPNLPKALGLCRKLGLKFDIMATSFFLGRRSIVPSAQSGMPLWQDKIFIFLMKNAANPTDFYKIPPGRVVELGTQVSV